MFRRFLMRQVAQTWPPGSDCYRRLKIQPCVRRADASRRQLRHVLSDHLQGEKKTKTQNTTAAYEQSADATHFYEIHSIEFRLTNELHCKYSVTRSLIAVTQHGGVTVYRCGLRLFSEECVTDRNNHRRRLPACGCQTIPVLTRP